MTDLFCDYSRFFSLVYDRFNIEIMIKEKEEENILHLGVNHKQQNLLGIYDNGCRPVEVDCRKQLKMQKRQ